VSKVITKAQDAVKPVLAGASSLLLSKPVQPISSAVQTSVPKGFELVPQITKAAAPAIQQISKVVPIAAAGAAGLAVGKVLGEIIGSVIKPIVNPAKQVTVSQQEFQKFTQALPVIKMSPDKIEASKVTKIPTGVGSVQQVQKKYQDVLKQNIYVPDLTYPQLQPQTLLGQVTKINTDNMAFPDMSQLGGYLQTGSQIVSGLQKVVFFPVVQVEE